jgi:hypothetical protein
MMAADSDSEAMLAAAAYGAATRSGSDGYTNEAEGPGS